MENTHKWDSPRTNVGKTSRYAERKCINCGITISNVGLKIKDNESIFPIKLIDKALSTVKILSV